MDFFNKMLWSRSLFIVVKISFRNSVFYEYYPTLNARAESLNPFDLKMNKKALKSNKKFPILNV